MSSRKLSRRDFFRASALAAGSVVTAPILAACGGGQPQAPAATPAAKAPAPAAQAPTAAPAAVAKPGGKLTVGVAADVKTLDPHLGSAGVWRAQVTSLYDTAIRLDPNDFSLKPGLIKSWEWADLTTLKLTLQDGVTFHNGTKFTAEDLKWNIDRIRDPKTASPWISGWTSVDSVTVDDPSHLTVKMKAPSVGLPFQMTYLWIIPKDGDPQKGIGTGPFSLAEYTPNATFRLKKNPSYWEKGQPMLEEVSYKLLPEVEARYAALEAGDVDIAYDVPMKDVPRMQGRRGLAVVYAKPADQHFLVHINITRTPLDNQKLRQAIAYCIDRVTFMKQFTGGIGRPGCSPIPSGHWAYNEKVDKWYSYDLEKAKMLLAEAGFPGGKGLRPLVFLLPLGYPEFTAGAEMMQAALSTIGIQTKIETLEIATWLKMLPDHEYDLAWDYPGRAAGDPDFMFSGVIYSPSEKNWWGVNEKTLPAYVQEVKAGGSTTDQAKRKEHYFKALEVLTDFAVPLVVGQRTTVAVLKDTVKGFGVHPLHLLSFGPVWIDK